jgi:pyroglutamyl-peptidase
VCNDLLYTLLAHYRETQTRVGFIHIPYSEDQNKTPSMALSDMIRGLIAAIESMD